MNTLNRYAKLFLVASLAIATTTFNSSCNKSDDMLVEPVVSIVKPDVDFYGLTDMNQLIKYNAKSTDMPAAAINITGLQAAENILSIDFRPATGQLYGLGSSSRLYQINLNTGAATAIGAASFTPALMGTVANIDFNPTVDRVRLVTSTGQNYRLHPETGAVVATDLAINGISNADISSIAYTNSFAGATVTELLDIDFTSKKLYKQNPPNDGALVEVGPLNINFTGKAGFDINGDNSKVLLTCKVDGVTKLYSLNTATAASSFIANINATLIDIAIPTNDVAYAISDAGAFQIFNPKNASTVINKTITGLNAGETILGIDFRPINGQLYGLASTALGAARLVTFNLSTGAAAGVGTGFLINAGTNATGFDFNPTVDRIRLVTNQGQNLRLNPIDGTIAATDANLNPGTPTITGAAYTNNFAGATTTTLFVMDATKLYVQNPPNAGTSVEVGNLGVTIDAQNGFDIGGKSNNAFALLTINNVTKVYSINTTTGAATAGSDYPNKVAAMAVGIGF